MNRTFVSFHAKTFIVAGLLHGLTLLILGFVHGLKSTAHAQASAVQVTGRVTDQVSGASVASARIAVIDPSVQDTLATVLTDLQGRYSVTFATDVAAERGAVPSRYRLFDVYPNPIEAGPITIRYATPADRPEIPQLDLYDILGRRITGAEVLAAGVYFVRLRFEQENVTDVKRLVLVGGGLADLRLQQVRAPMSSTNAAAGKRMAGEVLFVVEKPGFQRLETAVQISGTGASVEDFSLERVDTGRARLAVRVTDTSGELITDVHADVVDDTLAATTNQFGEAILDSVYTGVPVVVRLTKEGFNTQIVRTEVRTDVDVYLVEATMRQREAPLTIQNVQQGGEALGVDGAKVELPGSALVDADGNPVTGSIEVFLTPLDVTAEGGLEAFPGTFAGFEAGGDLKMILTLGVTDIVLEQNGAELDLAGGQTATIELPLYIERNELGEPLQEGDTIPLWSLDEATGLWVQETIGIVVSSMESPTGLALRGEVTHFSSWNCDVAVNAASVDISGPSKAAGMVFSGKTRDGSVPSFAVRNTDGMGSMASSVEGTTLTTFVPPGVEVELSLQTPPRVGVGGLEVCRWSEIIMAEPNAELDLVAELACEPLDTGGDDEFLEPPALVERAIDPAGEIDTYLFESTVGDGAVVSVCRSGPTSLLSGSVALKTPTGITIRQSGFGSFCGNVTFEMEEAGLYTAVVDGTFNEPEAYELHLNVGPIAPLNAPTSGTFAGDGTVARHFFRPQPGDVVTVSYGSDEVTASVTGSVRLFEDRVNIAHLSAGSGGFGQTTFAVEEDRPYVLELKPSVGATGEYAVTASALEQPAPFTLAGEITEITGAIDFFGERQFHSFEGEVGRLLNVVLDLSDARTQLTVKRPSQAYYDIVSHANVAHETDEDELDTGPFLLTETGDWIVEVSHPSRAFPGLDALLGDFSFQIYAPEVRSLEPDSLYEASIDGPRTFGAYTFTLDEDRSVNIRTTLTSGGSVVPRLLDASDRQLAQTIVMNPGESSELARQLAAGTYYVVVEPVDAALEYQLELEISE